MRVIAVVVASLCLSACGGGGGDSDNSRNAIAASACEAFAKNEMGNKTFQLDLGVLGASMKPSADMQALTGPIVIEPGLSGETKMTLDCKVRFNADGSKADVISLSYVY